MITITWYDASLFVANKTAHTTLVICMHRQNFLCQLICYLVEYVFKGTWLKCAKIHKQ